MITDSVSIDKYRKIMSRLIKSCYPNITNHDLIEGINFSIDKRYKKFSGKIANNYTKKTIDMTVLEMCDYIASREPIITSYGVMFKRHETVPNPMAKVIDSFMELRNIHKKEMFKYPKGSELFERYNLFQNLDKIDTNSIYGLLGLYMSIVFDINVAPSITSMGRSLISSAIMCFEMFLSNNVKFGSLNEVLTFIDNVRTEASSWKFDDRMILDNNKWVTQEECFYKVVYTCGYKYVPDEEDLTIIWNIIQNCSPVELNRLYYKNNLYSFMDNSIMQNLLKQILTTLKHPYMEPMKPPKEIVEPLNQFRDYLLEYVFYNYQIMDRMDRNKNMIKNVSIISDTDSSFVSLDAWCHYCTNNIMGMDMPILHQHLDVIQYFDNLKKEEEKMGKEEHQEIDPTYLQTSISFFDTDEFGDPIDPSFRDAIRFEDPVLDYNFYDDDIIELEKEIDVCEFLPQDNLRFSLINIMAYVLDGVINEYMIDFTKQSHSYRGDDKCRIIMKNEFYMYRVLMTQVKKHYAAWQGVQEGNYLGKDGFLDAKGIECLAKSNISESTKKKLKRILLEDILKAPTIDQMQVIKDMAIVERQIYNDVIKGSKTYYKPLTVKSATHYKDPYTEQGIKGSLVWNYAKDEGIEGIDLTIRNGLDIAKTNITMTTIEKIKDTFPYQYERLKDLLDPTRSTVIAKDERTHKDRLAIDVFKGNITSVALPKDAKVPEWLLPLIDIESIVVDNLSKFPLESIGISKLDTKKGVVYTNAIKL